MISKKVIIIDGNYLMFRSFYSTLKWFKNKNYNAVWGFKKTLSMLDKPDVTVLVVFDIGKSFRHNLDVSYKANRPKMPENLKRQFPLLKAELKMQKIKYFQKLGYEADDLIGILCNKLKDFTSEILILSADKDLNQLITDKVKMFRYKKKKWIVYSEQNVIDDYGIRPNQFADFLAITGDKVDNIPQAIPKTGSKTATKLLQQFNSISNLITVKEYKPYRDKLLYNLKLTTILTSMDNRIT